MTEYVVIELLAENFSKKLPDVDLMESREPEEEEDEISLTIIPPLAFF